MRSVSHKTVKDSPYLRLAEAFVGKTYWSENLLGRVSWWRRHGLHQSSHRNETYSKPVASGGLPSDETASGTETNGETHGEDGVSSNVKEEFWQWGHGEQMDITRG